MAAKAPTVVPKGALLMSIVTEGSRPDNKATKAQVDNWIGKAMAPFGMTQDSVAPQPFMEDFFGVARDTYIIIDLKTMMIVEIFEQDVTGALAKLESLL